MTAVHAQPARPATRGRRMVAPLGSIAALSLTTLALHLRDPHQHGTWGLCPLYATTGIYCPGCGGLRAVNDLTNGHVGAALSSNVLVGLVVPIGVFLLARWALDRWRGTPRQLDLRLAAPAGYAFLAIALVFSVLRNTPAGAWLAP
jgi:hypothetical protein